MDLLFYIINIFKISFVELFLLFGTIILVGFLLGLLERYSNFYLVHTFGSKGIIATAWIGTPIHELGHLIQCFIWGHRVTRVKLLQLNDPAGVLGYVEHQYNRNSMYQQAGNFFIGLGPVFSGIGSLILSLYLFLPQTYKSFHSHLLQHLISNKLDLTFYKRIAGALFVFSKTLFTLDNLLNPLFWLFLFTSVSISSHIALSRADIHGSTKGLLMIYFVLLLFNAVASIIGFNSYTIVVKLSQLNTYVIAFSSIAFLFSLFTLVISFLLYKVKQLI